MKNYYRIRGRKTTLSVSSDNVVGLESVFGAEKPDQDILRNILALWKTYNPEWVPEKIPVEKYEGMSGCEDFYLAPKKFYKVMSDTSAILEYQTAKKTIMHLSMYGKLNEGLEVDSDEKANGVYSVFKTLYPDYDIDTEDLENLVPMEDVGIVFKIGCEMLIHAPAWELILWRAYVLHEGEPCWLNKKDFDLLIENTYRIKQESLPIIIQIGKEFPNGGGFVVFFLREGNEDEKDEESS